MKCPACAEYPLPVHRDMQVVLFDKNEPVAWICETHGLFGYEEYA